ncbi:MAG: hypothetical protein ACHQF4_10710 [Sphingobacteriales bacterium]
MKSMYGDESPLMKMGPEYMIYSSRVNNQVYISTSHNVAVPSFSISKTDIRSKNKAKK